MFKTLKKRSEKVKEKLDFKFRFHATRVPLTGWDKLVVSLVPSDTGKAVIKTPRATVRNGNCQWLDSVIESTRLVQDVKTKEYEEKPYKLVVSMGSSRSGILGETSINLAEYAITNDPAQIALPLKNCNAGTVLHVNVQCLTPKASSRPLAFMQSHSSDLSERSNQSLDQDDQEFASDEDLDDSDVSESHASMSIASSAGQIPTAPSCAKPSIGTASPSRFHTRDGSTLSQLRYSSDSLEVPSTPSSINGSGRSFSNADLPSPTVPASGPGQHSRSASREGNSRSGNNNQDTNSSAAPYSRANISSMNSTGQGQRNVWQDIHGRPVDRSAQGQTSENGVHRYQEAYNGGQASLQADLEAAEITIEELRSESLTWQRQAHKLSLEADNLKQKLGVQLKHWAEIDAEKSALTAERDRLQMELDQLQAEREASQEREHGEGHASRQAEDARRMIKELEEEICYQKEMNVNLKLQLEKTQYSSMELVLAIQDMEETLDEQKKGLDSLKAENSRLESSMSEYRKQSLSVGDVEKTWMEKVEDKELQIKDLQSKLLLFESNSTSSSFTTIADSTDELVQTSQRMAGNLQDDLEELRNKAKEVMDENMELQTNLSKIREELHTKTALVVELESELKRQSYSAHANSYAITVGDCEDLSSQKPVVNVLEENVQATEESYREPLGVEKKDGVQYSATVLGMVDTNLGNKLSEAYEEIPRLGLVLEFSTKARECAEKERELMPTQQQKKEKEAKLEEEHACALQHMAETQKDALQKLECYESELAGLKLRNEESLKSNTPADYSLQDQDNENVQLIEKLRSAEAVGEELLAKIQTRELEIADLLQEMAIQGARSREMAMKVTVLENLQLELESKCSEYQGNNSRSDEVNFSLREAYKKIAELESEKSGSDRMLQDAKEAGRLNRSQIKELEIHLSVLTDEIESLRSQNNGEESRVVDFENEKNELEHRLQILLEERRIANEQAQEFICEVDGLKKQLDSLSAAKKNCERRIQDLESVICDLESQVADLDAENFGQLERISGLEAQLRYVTEERETYKLGKEDSETRLKDLQLDKCKAESFYQESVKEHQHRLLEVEENAVMLIGEMHVHKAARQNLEVLVDQLKSQISILEVSNRETEGRAIDRLKRSQELEEQLSKLNADYLTAIARVSSLETEVLSLKEEILNQQNFFAAEGESLNASKAELEYRAYRAEAAQEQTSLEYKCIIEQLQSEVQRLVEEMSSSSDEKEKVAFQALIEASNLRSENSGLEEKLRKLEENYKQSVTGVSAARVDFDAKVNDMKMQFESSKARELEAMNRLEVTVKQLEVLRQSEEFHRSRLEDSANKLRVLESDNERLVRERDGLMARAQEAAILMENLASLQSVVSSVKSENASLEVSLEKGHTALLAAQDEKVSLAKGLAQALAEVDDMQRSKRALEEKLVRLQSELDAQKAARSLEAEQRTEALRLKRQNTEHKRKISVSEEEIEGFQTKVQLLQNELQHKIDDLAAAEKKLKEREDEKGRAAGGTSSSRSLSRSNSRVVPMSMSRDSIEIAELRDKVRSLQVELKSKTEMMELLKQDFKHKETALCHKIGMATEEPGVGGSNPGLDQVQTKLERLQTQNSSLTRREQELLSQLSVEDGLRKEIHRLHELSEQQESKLIRFKEAAKDGDILEKVVMLETELSEALEANNMYKLQLRSAFAEQQNVHAAALQNFGDVDQVINDLLTFKKQSVVLGEELKEMRERYSRMSLQFAEVEAQREELVMTVRTLKNSRKS